MFFAGSSKKRNETVEQEKYDDKFIRLMVDLWVKDEAPEWVKEKVADELRKQRRSYGIL